MTIFNLFFYWFAASLCDQAATMVYRITPIESDLYPIQPFQTLSKFAADFSNQFTQMLHRSFFLEISLYVNISVSNVDRFVMESENTTPSITCENHSCLSFNSVEHIHIRKIKFIGCGGNTFESVGELLLEHSNFRVKVSVLQH